MNKALILVVSTGAGQSDFERALREQLASREICEIRLQAKSVQNERSDMDELPLWTWFVPHPLPQPKIFEAEVCLGFAKINM